MRLIDADVLKQHIDKLPALPDGNFAGNHSALKALINMQPTIESEPHWIPVSERLPDNKSPVMITCDGLIFDSRVVALALYDDKTFFNFDGQKIGKVYAWMPLPKAFEVKEE